MTIYISNQNNIYMQQGDFISLLIVLIEMENIDTILTVFGGQSNEQLVLYVFIK